jgi:hypothetical protein
MMFSRISALLLASASLASFASASIVINITARQLTEDAEGTVPLAAGRLIQLINLGADGILNPINLQDGDISPLGQWVSGDDTLVNVPFTINSGSQGDYPSAAAFDLVAGNDVTFGRLSRQFEFDTGAIAAGAKLGIRWFPGLNAVDFSTITLTDSQRYGEFSRQAGALYGLDLWVAPADGAQVFFDNLKTTNQVGGLDPISVGAATLTVPEPTAIAMSLIGAAGLGMLRRRRA